VTCYYFYMTFLVTAVGVGWLAFWIYWLLSAFGSKKTKVYANRSGLGVRLILFISTVLLIRVGISRRALFSGIHGLINNDAVMIIGFILFILGLALAIWARLYLGRNWGMPMTLKQDPELVTTGPYHFIRHPIYSGILLASFATALVINIDWLLVFIVVGAYFIYSATVEEKIMLKQFPGSYPAYKQKTKMLIPFIL
jgi:protein-S-isoprenylcysteine O-methyltransferase Ste14